MHESLGAVGLAILGNQFIVILYLRHASRIRFHFFSLLDYCDLPTRLFTLFITVGPSLSFLVGHSALCSVIGNI